MDGNVSTIAVASIERDTPQPTVLTLHVTATAAQRQITVREATKARDRMRALDRFRRATHTSQYRLSRNQQARAGRRAAAGLPARTVDTPAGARIANSAGILRQAYRKDVISQSYRDLRADHCAAASAISRRKDAFARRTAQAIVAAHGPHVITEDVGVRDWSRRWGRGVAASTDQANKQHPNDSTVRNSRLMNQLLDDTHQVLVRSTISAANWAVAMAALRRAAKSTTR